MKHLSEWSIENVNNFYAYGMHNIGNSTKKTVIVLYGHTQLITISIKDIDTVENGRIRIDKQFCIPVKSTITSITDNSQHTLCQDDNGCLLYFETAKTVAYLHCLENIKAVCAMQPSGFCVITSGADNGLSLVVYTEKDLKKIESNTTTNSKSFDLSWDPNNTICPTRAQETYNLLHVMLKKDNIQLIAKLINGTPSDIREIFLYSIDANLNCLKYNVADHTDYELIAVKIFSSHIKQMWFSEKLSALIVLLVSGVLEILYLDKAMDLLRQKQIFFANDLLAGELIEGDIFVYIDGDSFYQVNLYYSVVCDEIQHTTKQTEWVGGVAFTYLKSISSCFCVTENNLFYSIKITKDTDSEQNFLEADSNYIEIDQKFIQNAETVIEQLRYENTINLRLDQHIYTEYEKFKILNIHHNKNLYGSLCKAQLQICPWLPTAAVLENYTKFVAPPIKSLKSLSYVDIQIDIDSKVCSVFKGKLWSTNVTMQISSSTKYSYVFQVENSEGNHLSYFIPFDDSQLITLPEIKIDFVSFVACGEDLLRVSIPVTVTPVMTKQIFTHAAHKFLNAQPSTSTEEIIAKMSSLLTLSRQTIEYKITVPGNTEASDIFRHILTTDTTENSCEIYFFGELIQIEFTQSTRQLKIQSKHAGGLYYLKCLIFDYFFGETQLESYGLPVKTLGMLKATETSLRNKKSLKNKEMQMHYESVRAISSHFELN